ncbi:hypothetical protein CGZ80_00945 [Rhodopirellula sp. MGV]|nr:hypothetical protein CGZ80_00945 [Rhodopirellula sp. MGV]PNY37633.1 hypothetical protein C2E31_06680 [Rhodopirellula baltica]
MNLPRLRAANEPDPLTFRNEPTKLDLFLGRTRIPDSSPKGSRLHSLVGGMQLPIASLANHCRHTIERIPPPAHLDNHRGVADQQHCRFGACRMPAVKHLLLLGRL